MCQNYILNGLDNILYNVYSPIKTAKELWDSLDKKYKTEDVAAKKFVVGKFLEYMMVDSKSVISQVQEIQLILHDIHAEGMSIGESFQVAAIIEKLPPSWKEFKNYLKHKRKEMKLEELIVHLRIEGDNHNSDKKGKNPMVAKANVVEHGGTSNSKKRKHTGQGSKQGPNSGGNKKAKFQGKCFKCDKIGHRAAECRSKPKDGYANKKPAQANVTEVEDLSDGILDMHLSTVVSEVNMIDSNSKE